MGYRGGSLASFGAEGPMREAQRRTVERVSTLMRDRVMIHTPIAKPPVPDVYSDWLASRKRMPGTLKASWKIGEITITGDVMGVEVYTDDNIAPYVEYPTMPHLIVAKNGMLRFYAGATTPGRIPGELVYAQVVHHTGTKGTYMMATTIGEMAVEWQAIGAEEMETWAREQTEAIAV